MLRSLTRAPPQAWHKVGREEQRLDAPTSTEQRTGFDGPKGLETNVAYATSGSTSNRLLVAQSYPHSITMSNNVSL
jgi:hypothetical protein